MSRDRRRLASTDPRLRDRVADNTFKFDSTERESLLIGRNFGVGTDVQTGPNGHLFIVSLSNGAVYEIFRKPSAGQDDRDRVDQEQDDQATDNPDGGGEQD